MITRGYRSIEISGGSPQREEGIRREVVRRHSHDSHSEPNSPRISRSRSGPPTAAKWLSINPPSNYK
ncbi:hypothetical protein J6590_001868 [Homalodisca vitripennis]|nr:hypothetical protein J6590_001868 [Homalodisca vitripennis]